MPGDQSQMPLLDGCRSDEEDERITNDDDEVIDMYPM